MRLILDSNEYIFGLSENLNRPASIELMNRIPDLSEAITDLVLIVPNIIRLEVHRNLPVHRRSQFYRLMRHRAFVLRWADEVPETLYRKYNSQMKEEDALIAAIAETEHVDCIISDNRHFYEQLQTQVFLTVTAEQFLHAIDTDEIWQMIRQVQQNRVLNS